ncbi:penicillin acylase family protein [Chryseolinea sp. T2]|uniref:penicillin acylase family protein n=1 Tax=Chryseolinea sp. T2 TaxID=3129255 RepID=UPI003077B028
MKIFKRIVIGLVVVIFAIIIGLYFYLLSTAPDYSGTVILDGLKAEVQVLYDNYGVPHIYAQNEEDAYFALGYVHAQDRLFQMEMLRRAAGGRLSEILGEDLIKVDKLFRTLGINQFAKEHARKFLNADTAAFQKDALAYQKGVNQYIKTGKTPIEFTIIGIPKEEFKPEDIYLAVGFMSFGFAEGLHADPVLQKIRSEYGDEYLTDFAVQTPPDAIKIKSYKGAIKNSPGDSLIATIDEALSKIPAPLWSGSNGWVVAGSRTESGYPILENDTHIGFGQPAVWYEAHMEYSGKSFYGHHIAGIPFGLLGNNRHSGWGLTMFENDDADFYFETVNPHKVNQVKFRDQWEDLSVRKEIIKVKGRPDVELEVRSSRHGALINGIMENAPEEQAVALSWILTRETNEALQAAWLLNHAQSFRDAEKAAATFSAPGLNVMYADVDGNIAWWACAKLPVRPKHAVSKLFLDGASGNDEYQGYYDFTKNPQVINPPWGYVYSANNQPDTVDGVLYPGYYYPKARAGRIVEYLSKDKEWKSDDMKEVNLDVVSISAPEVAKEMATVLKSLNKEEYAPLIELLQNWNGDHKSTDTAPSVYYNMLSQIYYLTMKDEIGADALHSILATSVPKNSVNKFIKNESSPWWDDIHTRSISETRAMIFDKAAQKTLTLLHESCGDKPEDWVWGKIHTLKHKHPLGVVSVLDKLFSVGPFPVDGGNEVLNNLHFELDTTGYFHVTGGPALRKIMDFGAIEKGETVSPSGQSGNVMSSYYSDQAEMYATGKFRKMLMNKEEIEKASGNRLVLKPR